MRRSTLARRTGWVMAAVVVIAVLVAAVVSVGLVRSSARNEAVKALRSQADVVAGLLEVGRPRDLGKAMQVVRLEGTPAAWVSTNGTLHGEALPRRAYLKRAGTPTHATPDSFTVSIDGHEVLVEVRPLGSGAKVILAKTVSLAAGPSRQLLQRELIALAIGLLVALVASALFARWLDAPLRRTAAAAARLAAGERSVRLDPGGPREVVAVSAALNTLAAALGRSEGRQREFLMSVSHELRTPLTAIRGFGESLADGVTEGDDVPHAGRVIVAESARLERLVADLLDLARLGAADFRFELVPIDLRAVVQEAASVWEPRCAGARVRFAAELPPDPVPAVSDPGRVRQIIDGLAENALRVTPAGRPLVIALRATPAVATVEVRDGGPGLTDDDIAVAFDRSVLYERYRGIRKVGTGLGLALVKALADGLGGAVEAGRAAEGGSCFRVRLPVDSPAAAGTVRPGGRDAQG